MPEGIDAILSTAVLLLWGIPVVYFDLTRHRIPNFLTYSGMFAGLAIFLLWRRDQLADYPVAFLIAFGLYYVCYMFGWIGGGDVKLMAMIGLLGGKSFLVETMLYSAVVGGLIALGVALALLFRSRSPRGAAIPYGTAIVAGVYLVVFASPAGALAP
jgi:prepilin peptidase CpaA